MGRSPTITNEQILEAAREVFLAEGFGASTVEIARRAKVSEGSIFKRFSTKEELFFAAMGISEVPAWIKELETLSGQGDLKENLITLSLNILEFFREVVPRITMMCAQGTPPPEMESLRKSLPVRDIKAVTIFFDREQKLGRIRQCDPEVAARILIGSLMNYTFMEHIGVHASLPIAAPTYVRGVIEILWQGMAPP
jgi:AcrR family transcriptional regulator